MTAQDVAGVIADDDLVKELRQQARNRTSDIGADAHTATAEWRAAARLESQAQALSEAEGGRDRWHRVAMQAGVIVCVDGSLMYSMTDRALAAESRLAEAMRVIGFYADYRRYDGPNQRPIPDDPFAKPDAVYICDVTRDGGSLARDFLNAAKEKT